TKYGKRKLFINQRSNRQSRDEGACRDCDILQNIAFSRTKKAPRPKVQRLVEKIPFIADDPEPSEPRLSQQPRKGSLRAGHVKQKKRGGDLYQPLRGLRPPVLVEYSIFI